MERRTLSGERSRVYICIQFRLWDGRQLRIHPSIMTDTVRSTRRTSDAFTLPAVSFLIGLAMGVLASLSTFSGRMASVETRLTNIESTLHDAISPMFKNTHP